MMETYISFMVRIWDQVNLGECQGPKERASLGEVYIIQTGVTIPFTSLDGFYHILIEELNVTNYYPISLKRNRRTTMSIETTRQIMQRYLDSNHTDLTMLAEDVIFTMMGTGEATQGKEAVQGMLAYFYSIAFQARAEERTVIFGDGKAFFEGEFVGKHIGEFAGVPPTGKEVRVPMCVVYELEGDRIAQARIYFEMGVLMAQLGVGQAAPQAAG